MTRHLGVLTITWDGQFFVLMTSRAGMIERFTQIKDEDLNIPADLKAYLKLETPSA